MASKKQVKLGGMPYSMPFLTVTNKMSAALYLAKRNAIAAACPMEDLGFHDIPQPG